MTEFKKSPVVFNEDDHSYFLGEKRLAGITGLIHSVLGLGVYPDASAYAKDYAIPRAGSRGTAVHRAIQTYDELGVKQPIQIVRTTYGCDKRGNLRCVDEVWDVSYQLEAYIRHLNGFKALANELTVSDNVRFASQIDNVWLNEQTGGIWLVDTKTNNLSVYPLCGYYVRNYFSNAEDALKEYLSWQLSIYAVLFESENPGYKVEGLACNWLREDDAALWEIVRKPTELVMELLKAEPVFTDNGVLYFHPDPSIFRVDNQSIIQQDEPKSIVERKVVDYFTSLLKQEKELKKKIEEARSALSAAMEQHNVKSYDFGSFCATLTTESVAETFDSSRFKKENPELYKEYLKKTKRKSGITVKLKK